MHPYKRFVRVLPLVLIWGSGVRADDPADTEPNDTAETAVHTSLLDEGSVMVQDASLGYQQVDPYDEFVDCRDIYRLNVSSGAPPRLVTISVDSGSATLDPYVRLFYGEQGSEGEILEVSCNDDIAYPNLDSYLRAYLLEEGTYYVGASPGRYASYELADEATECPEWEDEWSTDGLDGTYGTYDLTITLGGTELPDSPYEPNDDSGDATSVGGASFEALGEFIGDGANSYWDVDMYEISLSSPAIIQADALVTDLDSPLDPVLVLEYSGDTVAINDNANLKTYDAHIEAAVFESGSYYLTVYGAGRSDGVPPDGRGQRGTSQGHPGSVGHYDLSITVTPLDDPGGSLEPNDSILEPTPVGLSGAEVVFFAYIGDGRFAATRGDVDFYEIEADEGDVLMVDVDAAVTGSELDPLVVVFDYLGKVLAANDNDGLTTDSLVLVEARAPAPDSLPATLYVMVMGTRQVRPPDPLVPNPYTPDEGRCSEHIVTGAFSSTGPYEVTFAFDHNCCLTGHGPGCSLPEIEACVCELDPYCCTVEWDEFCVAEVTSFGCGICRAGFFRQGAADPPQPRQPQPQRIFATTIDSPPDAIVELDPADGLQLNRYEIPEDMVTTGQGLALWDDTLFYLGSGRFPKLYWLDPDTGEVASQTVLWSGTGYYSDLAVLNGRIFVTDVLESSLHELDPQTLEAVRTIEVGVLNDIALSGPIASLAGPDRLYVVDAGSSNNCCEAHSGPGCTDPEIATCVCQVAPWCCEQEWDEGCVDLVWSEDCGSCETPAGAIYPIDPASGESEMSMATGLPCPCNADFDGDGDVDGDDLAVFDECEALDCEPDGCGGVYISYGCNMADLNCDSLIDEDDQGIFDCQEAGPGQPPGEDCCPPDLPPMAVQATALAGSGNATLYINDWRRESIEVYDTEGTLLDVLALQTSIGALGGEAFAVFGDSDSDGDVDLTDFLAFTDCLTGPTQAGVPAECCMFDAYSDCDVDLEDLAIFQMAFTGGL